MTDLFMIIGIGLGSIIIIWLLVSYLMEFFTKLISTLKEIMPWT